MGNSAARPESVMEEGLDLSMTDEHTVNRGTSELRQPLLTFHSVHGENVSLSRCGRVAKRSNSFCKGLAFSSRPILVGEVVCVKLAEVSSTWSGVLRFGVTNVDPASFRDIELPKFACPDLTSKGGFWAKALPERFSVQNCILHFVVDSDGNLHYGIDGMSRGVFLSRVNAHSQLWAIFDIYGNSKTIEFIDTQHASPAELELFSRAQATPPADPIIRTPTPPQPTSQHDEADPLRFNRICGPNAKIDNGGKDAVRVRSEFCQAYVFTHRPMKMNEKLSIIVQRQNGDFIGSLAFGLTSCDPESITDLNSLPLDSDNLLERPEYWVCIKNVAVTPRVGDSASFWVLPTGEVMFSKNEHSPRTIMHVDTSVRLWAFFDLYGSTSKIRLAGPTELASRPRQAVSSLESPSELAVVTPPLRTSVTDVNRLLREMGSLRVELPPSPVNSSPRSIGGNTDDEDDDRLNDFNRRLQTLRERAHRIDEVERALELERERFNSVSAPSRRIPPSSGPISVERIHIPATTSSSLTSHSLRDTPVRSISQTRSRPTAALTSYLSSRPALLSEIPSFTRYSSSPSSTSLTPLDHNLSTITSNSLSIPSTGHTSRSAEPSSSSPPQQSHLTLSMHQAHSDPTVSLMTAPRPDPSLYPTVDKSMLVGGGADPGTAGGIDTECVVCMSDRVNSVLYRCGHMCMCYNCAQETMRGTRTCPLCRQSILDVIRCYQS